MKQWNVIFKKQGRFFLKPTRDFIKIVDVFKKYGVKKFLDLGCGSGRHVVYLAKKGFNVYGFDIAKDGISIAKDWLKKEKLKANFKVGSIYDKLPYRNNFFDAVISTQAIHHGKIEDIRRAIKEVERILKPNSLIFLTVRKRKIRRFDPKNLIIEKYGKQKASYKMIAPRTYIPIEGGEKGLPHYLFDKKQINKEFCDFKNSKIWISQDKRHYCFIGKLKK